MTSPVPLRKNRPDWWVTPCRTCGEAGDNFDLRADPRKPYGLTRYCVPCNAIRSAEARMSKPGRQVVYHDTYRRKIANEPCAFAGCGRSRHGRFCVGHAKQKTKAGGDESKMRPLRPYNGGKAPCFECGKSTTPEQRSNGLCNGCWMRRWRAEQRRQA